MNSDHIIFDEHKVLHKLKHFLPAQAPLKDFIHHNTLHAFQDRKFDLGLREASEIFGYKVSLSLKEYRELYKKKIISDEVVNRILTERKAAECDKWKSKMLEGEYDENQQPRIGKLRGLWKTLYRIDLDSQIHPVLFRTVCSYLDQGIAIWNFPVHHKGFLPSLKELEKNSYSSFFKTKRAKDFLVNEKWELKRLLHILVGDESLYEQYLFDLQFSHQGWSGMVSTIEDNPHFLLDQKKISLHDFIFFELLMEIDALDFQFEDDWIPLGIRMKDHPAPLFDPVHLSEKQEILALWQTAYEWSYYDEVLAGIQHTCSIENKSISPSFQAMFCIDDREGSLRRYLEQFDPSCKTFGTPGFFSVEFYYKPENGKFHTKLCPAPVDPKFLIKETGSKQKRKKDAHFIQPTQTLFRGWLISQTLGFWSAMKLFANIFRPTMSAATAHSFRHMDKFSSLTIENVNGETENGLQVGFTIEEMTTRVENLLRSIGLVENFAPLIYVTGHGSSSVNNPHYAAYDCGACSGRPGSVNARVVCTMANDKRVRSHLRDRGISIPDSTHFIGALHDTTRDEIVFYDEEHLSEGNKIIHEKK